MFFQRRQHVSRRKRDPLSHFTSPFNIPKGCKANTWAEAVKHKETKALPSGTLSYFCLGAPRCAPVPARAAPLTPPAAVTEAGRAQRGHRGGEATHTGALHIALGTGALRRLGQGIPPRLMLLTYFTAQYNETPDSQNHRTDTVGRDLWPSSPA